MARTGVRLSPASEITTLNDIFYATAATGAEHLLRYKQSGQWVTISARDLYRKVVSTARQLMSWGIQRGDRVAIISETRAGWAIADYACLLLGVVDVPVYPTSTPEQIAYILRDSGCRAAFVSTAEQLKKLQSVRAQTALERIIVMDTAPFTDAEPLQQVMNSSLLESDPEMDAIARCVKPEDLATIIYTSGTTGTPKGVMLTHRNIVSNVMTSFKRFVWLEDEIYLSFLPLSHITARHVDYACMYHGMSIAYCPHIDDLARMILEVRPTLFISVPRVYEKIRAEARKRAAKSAWTQRVFDWALRVGERHVDDVIARKPIRSLRWKLANKLIYSKVLGAYGGRVRTFISGGAPLGIDTARWYAGVGIPINEGYGLTETSPVISINVPGHHKIGTVGQPLENMECKIAQDGELLAKGPAVFQGYWNLPGETRSAFTDDGWFQTGDIGHIDSDGFLSITDRKKDLIKTSGGKFIAPQPIENRLKANVLVAQAALVGDKRRFAAVIVSPHFPLLEDWARANGVTFVTRTDLVMNPKVQALYEGIVADVNKGLAQFETMKRVIVVPDEFTVASGEITPSLKLKRRVVEQKYKAQIEALYADESSRELPALR